jgi:hypothetical protein
MGKLYTVILPFEQETTDIIVETHYERISAADFYQVVAYGCYAQKVRSL